MKMAALFPIVLLAGCNAAPANPTVAAPQPSPVAATGNGPTVVELYQSQGCSSCPPAIRNVNAIADDPHVLALTFAVTYWDALGWKDTFAQQAFTARQWDYARAGQRDKVYTPQVVVNGGQAIVGANPAQLDQAVRAAKPLAGPEIGVTGNRLTVAAQSGAKAATVWLVSYDPREEVVKIRAGENAGRDLAHRNVVRAMTALGDWTGQAASYALPAPRNPHEARAVLLQQGTGGPIVAAKKLG